uniref:RRM domain-containing protein n=1 Tax=Loxodonta africana TaxID=9785 RepID=G3TU55_LOXAF
MVTTHYSTYSQAAQQGYSAYTSPPTQGCAQTTQVFGQQSYGTYADVSYTQAQTTAVNWQITLYCSCCLHMYSQLVQRYGTDAYDTTTAVKTTTCLPSLQQPVATMPARPQDGSKPTERNQLQSSIQSNYSYPQVPGRYPTQTVTTSPPCPPTSYPSTQLTSYQSSYSHQNTYGHPSSFGEQSSYDQSAMGSCPPLVTLPAPITGSCSQAPSRYSQQNTNYWQQNSFQQDHPSSVGVFRQGPGGFFGQEENWSMSGPDNSRGRGEFGFEGISRGGWRGGCGIMDSTGEQDGFSKTRGPMDKEPDLDLSSPVDPDEDSYSSAIYVQELNDNVTLDDVSDFLNQCAVKINERTGQPMIHISLDKETGNPRGDATVSFEDTPTAKVAMEWFDGNKVPLTQKKPSMEGIQDGMSPCERGMLPPCDGGLESPGDHGGDRGGFPPREPWDPSGGGNIQPQHWRLECLQPESGDKDFAWRTECNQCKSSDSEGFL